MFTFGVLFGTIFESVFRILFLKKTILLWLNIIAKLLLTLLIQLEGIEVLFYYDTCDVLCTFAKTT